MPWNGSGTYSLPPAYSPEVNGTVIDANRYNGLTTDVATGITNAVAKDGQNVPTANLPMGGFKHTGAGDATAAGQYLVYSQSTAANLTRLRLNVATEALPSLSFIGDTDTGLWSSEADTINFSIGGAEAWRMESAGRWVGNSSSGAQSTRVAATTVTPYLQTNGVSLSQATIGMFQWNATATNASYAVFARSRGATVGTHTIVQNGDAIGRLSFAGSDGTQFTEAARIQVQVSGTPGVNDMPGSLSILTTPDGASAPLTAVTFDQDQSATFVGAITSQSTARFNSGAYGVLGVRESGAYGGAGPSTAADSFVIEASVNGGLSILTPDANSGGIYFGDATSNSVGRINYNHGTDILSFRAGGTDKPFLTDDGRLYGNALHNNAGAVTGTTNQYIASGTWTATGTTSTNISAVTPNGGQWVRVGNVVHATQSITITITSASTLSTFRFSLPIAVNHTSGTNLNGVFTSGVTTVNGPITGNASTDDAQCIFTPTSNGTLGIVCTFTYEVL